MPTFKRLKTTKSMFGGSQTSFLAKERILSITTNYSYNTVSCATKKGPYK